MEDDEDIKLVEVNSIVGRESIACIMFRPCIQAAAWQRGGHKRLDFLEQVGLGWMSKVRWDVGPLASVKDFIANYDLAKDETLVGGRTVNFSPDMIASKLEIPNKGIRLMMVSKLNPDVSFDEYFTEGAYVPDQGYRHDKMCDPLLGSVFTVISEAVLMKHLATYSSATFVNTIRQAKEGTVVNWPVFLYEKIKQRLRDVKLKAMGNTRRRVRFQACPLVAYLLEKQDAPSVADAEQVKDEKLKISEHKEEGRQGFLHVGGTRNEFEKRRAETLGEADQLNNSTGKRNKGISEGYKTTLVSTSAHVERGCDDRDDGSGDEDVDVDVDGDEDDNGQLNTMSLVSGDTPQLKLSSLVSDFSNRLLQISGEMEKRGILEEELQAVRASETKVKNKNKQLERKNQGLESLNERLMLENDDLTNELVEAKRRREEDEQDRGFLKKEIGLLQQRAENLLAMTVALRTELEVKSFEYGDRIWERVQTEAWKQTRAAHTKLVDTISDLRAELDLLRKPTAF